MQILSVPDFLKYFASIRSRTGHVIDRIPDPEMEWRPGPGRFSFGDLVRHLGATERYMFAENAAGRPSIYPGHDASLAPGGPVATRAFFARMHAESLDIFASLSDADLLRPCTTPGGATMPVWKWLRAMVEHEVHHRGQIYHMLATLGVPTPPIFGLTSEEVRARSESRPA